MSEGSDVPITDKILLVHFDEKTGKHIASIAGIDGVTGRGATWGDAVNDLETTVRKRTAADQDLAERIAATGVFSGRFSIRVPVSVHRGLHAAALAEGVSLNSFIASVLAERVGMERQKKQAHTGDDIIPEEALIAMVEADNPSSLGTAARVTYAVLQDVSHKIGLALAILLGDRVVALDGSARATDHYGKFARRAYDAGHTALALALWRRGLSLSPDNLKSAAAYGLALYNLGRYKEAGEQLRRAPDREGRLTYFKASLHLAEKDPAMEDENALPKIADIMKEWAFGNASAEEATQWRSHLTDLEQLSRPDLRALLEELRTFAATYSRWK